MEAAVRGAAAACALAALLLAALASCGSVRYVPVERVRLDSVYLNKVMRDSVYLRDSVYVVDRGDTVTVFRYRYLFRDKVRTDTAFVTRRDSVAVPYPVERSLSAWQKAKMELGGWAMAALGALAAVFVGRIAWRIVRKRLGV